MNFTELFAKLPTSTFQDWESAARIQLKGKSLESIDVSFRQGADMPPYASGVSTSIDGGGSQGWVQFSSFVGGDKISGVTLLEALNGGAQGLEISFSELKSLSEQLLSVRFDFISLKINNLEPAQQTELIQLIPAEQRANAKVVVTLEEGAFPTDYDELSSSIGTVVLLLSPKLEVGNEPSFSRFFMALQASLSLAENTEQLRSISSSLGVEVELSQNYLQNIIYIHATRILFANTYNSFGILEPLPRPYLFGRVNPNTENESHETYLIDATARAVAGIGGGLDALTIEPYPDGDQLLAQRRARNIQNVLAIEGLLGLPLSAVEGAAFFETASIDLVSSVWPDS